MKKLKELNLEFPRIGMRIIKSAIAVLLCFVVDYYRNGAGIVVNHIGDSNPYLFACNRVLDTVIGIAIGVLVNIWGF